MEVDIVAIIFEEHAASVFRVVLPGLIRLPFVISVRVYRFVIVQTHGKVWEVGHMGTSYLNGPLGYGGHNTGCSLLPLVQTSFLFARSWVCWTTYLRGA